MRIADRYQSLIARTGATREVDKAKPADKSTAVGASRRFGSPAVLDVNVSARAQELATGSARLAELKASIKDGSFRIDTHAIASRLVGGDEE
jgi:anti-sigma28 factor (negative regulator of flagellin synthesis)